MLSLYRPGTSWLHRLPARGKVVGLLVVTIAILFVRSPVVAAAVLAVALVVLLSTGAPLRPLIRPLLGVLVLAVVLGVVRAWSQGWGDGVVASCRVIAVVLLAWSVTMTTRVADMMATVTRAAGVLRPLGVQPAVIGMTLALAIRCAPLMIRIVGTAQEARRARGARPGVTSLAVPVVVRSVRLADQVGDALLARGFDPDVED